MPRVQSKIGHDGAIVTVRVEIGETEEAALRAAGRPIPIPFPTTALIDTGASHTAVHPMILTHLGVAQTGTALVSVPGQDQVSLPLYRVRISLGARLPPFAVRATRIIPATHTVAVLIGRDILADATLLFDGENQAISLWF